MDMYDMNTQDILTSYKYNYFRSSQVEQVRITAVHVDSMAHSFLALFQLKTSHDQ